MQLSADNTSCSGSFGIQQLHKAKVDSKLHEYSSHPSLPTRSLPQNELACLPLISSWTQLHPCLNPHHIVLEPAIINTSWRRRCLRHYKRCEIFGLPRPSCTHDGKPCHNNLVDKESVEEGVQRYAEISYESKTLSRCPFCNSDVE